MILRNYDCLKFLIIFLYWLAPVSIHYFHQSGVVSFHQSGVVSSYILAFIHIWTIFLYIYNWYIFLYRLKGLNLIIIYIYFICCCFLKNSATWKLCRITIFWWNWRTLILITHYFIIFYFKIWKINYIF